ncbi:MAG: RNA polymerase sigma factor [Pyrinomonadaceae bacterium]
MSQAPAQIDELALEGARRLIARATDSRALSAVVLAPGIRATLQKYLLCDVPLASSSEIAQFCDALHADDVCLIAACERGDETAWRELMEKYQAMVRGVARSVCVSEDKAEDLQQSIWAELHGLRLRQDGKPAGKIGYYSGRGSLGGWLQAVVRQLAIDAHRRDAKLVQTETDTDFDYYTNDARDNGKEQARNISPAQSDPEQDFAERESAEKLEKALAFVVRELAAEDRLLVKLYYFDGLSLREAGAILCVHEATASRRLTRLHKEVRTRVEAVLMKDHGWTRAETARWMAEVSAGLETNLEALLVDEKVSR